MDYTGEFELVGNLKVGDQILQLILEMLPIMNFILMLSIKIMSQKMPFSTGIFINEIHFSLI